MREPRSAMGDLKRIRDIFCLGTFDDFATEALPYWIARAERLERALERACKYFGDTVDCPPAGKCWVGTGLTCAECWKKYFLEGDSDA